MSTPSTPLSTLSFRILPPVSPSQVPLPSDDDYLTVRTSEMYNFEDWNVAFQVENVVYRVHRYFFTRESEMFMSMLKSMQDTFIPLPDISCKDFEAILKFMYFTVFDPHEMTDEEWISVLHLSNMWSMKKVKRQAVRNLHCSESLGLVDRIIIAAKECVEEWLPQAYANLIEREEPLSVEEARKIIALAERQVGSVPGTDIMPLLAQGRERFLRTHNNRRWLSLSALDIVESLFAISDIAIYSKLSPPS